MQDTQHHFASIRDAKQFALAGSAIITLQSLKSGLHFTYKVKEAKQDDAPSRAQVHFVNLLTGPDNENDYRYLGLIRNGQFTLTRNSKAGPDAPAVRAFSYFWAITGEIPSQLVIHHENRCGRCARLLTVPESVTLGIGPECAAILGLDL